MPSLLVSVFLVGSLALSGPPRASIAAQSARDSVLQACTSMFGPSIDPENNLFDVSRFHVLEAKFDDQGRLAELGVVPRYWFVEDHPDWEEPEDFRELTETEYESLLSRLDEVKPKGNLVDRAKMSIVTNCTARIRDRYEAAELETGEVVDVRRADGLPRAIRYFVVRFIGVRHARRRSERTSTSPRLTTLPGWRLQRSARSGA